MINGGEIRLTASDDGVNASGTTCYLEINWAGMEPINYDGKAEISGGIIVAAGSLGMAETFGEYSTQASLMYGYASSQSAGTLLTLLDKKGETIVSYEPTKDYQSVVMSTQELEVGNTYTLYSGGTVDLLDEEGLSFGALLLVI